MSESIINALMHLFAIIESVKDDLEIDSGTLVVEPYLKKYLNSSLTSEYLNLYYDYLEFYRRSSGLVPKERELEIASVNILQVSKICNQLNKELIQSDRVTVFIQLMELINSDKKVTPKEDDFILLVAMNFNIPSKEVSDIKSFILDQDGKNINKNKALLIDNRLTEWPEEMATMMRKKNKHVEGITEFKHMYVQNLYGKILVLFIESINYFVFRYKGPLNLYLEGQKIYQDKFYTLKPGAIIKGPNINAIYEIQIAQKFLKNEDSHTITLTGDDISYKFKNSDNGIQPFTFAEQSGRLIGIMGGSGTGKSTLLNLLNGKIKPDRGQILLNGLSIENAVESGIVGYVPQDDLLFEELTVFQNLYFNAKISFSDFDENKIVKEVVRVLDNLDLYEIKDLVVGDPLNKSISGGQRKRLNIAMELMREPALLYVDEPTSGLSSMDSLKVMSLLKDITRKGKLVIAIIHQPSSEIYKLLDRLWILDKGGYPIYNGNPVEAVVYFKTMSTQVNAAESECPNCGNVIPEQILQIIEAKEINEQGKPTKTRKVTPEDWYTKYKKFIEPNLEKFKFDNILPKSNFHIPNVWNQFQIFSSRNFLTKITNKQYIFINLIQAPFLALVLSYFSKYVSEGGYIFAENKNLPVYIFMGIVVALFLGMSVSAEEIFKDRRILVRESFLNLSRFSYINSKISFLYMLSAIQTLLFVIIGNFILEIQGMLWYYWVMLFTVSCFANLVGLNISATLNSIISIYILIPFILVPQLLLGGAMISFDDLHKSMTNKKNVPLVGDLMSSRWAYEALCVAQFKENNFETNFFEVEQQISQSSYINSYLVPRLEIIVEDLKTKSEKSESKATSDWKLLKLEISKLGMTSGYPELAEKKLILDGENLSQSNLKKIQDYLIQVKTVARDKYSQAIENKEVVYQNLIESIGKEQIFEMQRNYSNKQIAGLVQNRNELDKLIQVGNELIQKKDPIYMMPTSKIGRSHFFAPYKRLGSWYIPTFYFNLTVIWLMTFVLYCTLYFNFFRKLIGKFGYTQKKRLKII